MKKTLSVTVEEKLIQWIDKEVETLKYRNRSYAVEAALSKLKEAEDASKR